MGIFSKEKVKEKLILVFDVGSSSVGGALFFMHKSRIPKIVFSIREPIIIEREMGVDRLLSLMTKSLDSVANKIYKAGFGAPTNVFCVLASPWYASQTRVIRLEKNMPFVFTPKLADELINKEISIFEDEYLKNDKHFGNSIRSIELKNIKIMLNGYETPEPVEKKIKELEMTIFIAISPEQVLQKIEKSIRRHFHIENIKFSSFAMASFAVVRDVYAHSKDFLLIDIGGEVTDISMVKSNTLHESISFPLGLNFIIRGVASALDSSFGEAKSFISLLKDGHQSESTAKKLEPIIDDLRKEWLKKFQDSLSNISNDISIPATIYITTNKDLAEFFLQTIKNEQFNQYTLTESKFQVIFLSTEVFYNMVALEKGVTSDPALFIDSIYINRFFN